MTSSTEPGGAPAADGMDPRPGTAAGAAGDPGPPSQPRGRRRTPNRFATAALALGAAGATLVTIVPAMVAAVIGLRRASRLGSGRARCWAGVALAVCWSAAAAYVIPHIVRASDPGCRAYKGPALTAYNKVITDFSGHRPAAVAADLTRAIRALGSAAARSRDDGAARALATLTRDLKAIRHDIQTGTVVSSATLGTLNSDATRTDSACGTLHI